MTYAKIQRISRDKIECDLTFLGFVILENRLKPDTLEIINSLMAANIRTVMVTGDNILTALSVAKDCDMVPTGQSVIIVTAKPKPMQPHEHELIYNLTGMSANNNQIGGNGTNVIGVPPGNVGNNFVGNSISMNLSNNHLQQLHADPLKSKPNGFMVNERDATAENGTNYVLLTTSNSIASLETVDTCTQTTQITQRDIELGDNKLNGNSFPYHPSDGDVYDDDNSMKLVPELPNNNYRFAMTGKTWSVIRDHFPELLPTFVTRGTVFARMSPDHKQALVLELQDLGYYVAMCGDGANDCGALKAAHTGISLSEAESSVASPFTSRNATIACVPNVIKEGRCALVTSIAIFKFMAAYSLVQFASVLILYSIDSNLTDIEFLYIDLFMISIFAFFFGKTESYVGPLVKQTPLNSLISLSPIASLIIHLVLAIGFQMMSWFYLQQQSWYEPFHYRADRKYEHACYENYTIFITSCFQFIILAVVFSKGAPYRKSIFTNIGFITSLVINTVFSIVLAIAPYGKFIELFDLMYPPDPMFRITLVVFGICNFILSMCVELFIIENLIFRRFRYRFHNVEKSRRKFLAIENDLRQKPAWPPISQFGNDLGSNGGGDCASTPTSATIPASNVNDDDHQSPKSFTEIRVESDCLTPFDNGNSVLNGFFDYIPSDVDSNGVSDSDSDDDHFIGNNYLAQTESSQTSEVKAIDSSDNSSIDPNNRPSPSTNNESSLPLNNNQFTNNINHESNVPYVHSRPDDSHHTITNHSILSLPIPKLLLTSSNDINAFSSSNELTNDKNMYHHNDNEIDNDVKTIINNCSTKNKCETLNNSNNEYEINEIYAASKS